VLDLFELWREHDRARLELKAAATRACVDKLWAERDALLAERAAASPDAIARIDARLTEIGNEIASTFEARDGRAVATLPESFLSRSLSFVLGAGAWTERGARCPSAPLSMWAVVGQSRSLQ